MRDDSKNPRGAIACGHPATAAAAQEMLDEGGTAFDAALAALCAATVAEPVLCSLAGGGFFMAWPDGQAPRLYDFFVQTPAARPGDPQAAADLDFYPVLVDFGTATQEFHIGLAAAATPGTVRGLFTVHRELGSLPMRRIVEPAARLAREGVPLRPVDSYLFSVVGPILTARADSSAAYTRPDGTLLREGDRITQPALAGTLEALAEEGDELFHSGAIGQQLVAACQQQGGLLTLADLESYRVERRRPLERRYHGARIVTNAPPSTGGILIAFALALLDGLDPARLGFGSAGHIALLTEVMALTNRARVEARLDEAASAAEEQAAARRILDEALLARYACEIRGHPPSLNGTTHISVVDNDGNIAALSLSNGEGCGYVLPGTGVMLNNMLGEADLNPGGFHGWARSSRLASMMAPTIALLADGGVVALGSGGSNRIRTAILQVLVNLIDFAMTPEQAVTAPRLHFEEGIANVEAGFPEGASLAALQSETIRPLIERSIAWPRHNLFFGGVHAVARGRDGRLAAAGDPRRGGAALVLQRPPG